MFSENPSIRNPFVCFVPLIRFLHREDTQQQITSF